MRRRRRYRTGARHAERPRASWLRSRQQKLRQPHRMRSESKDRKLYSILVAPPSGVSTGSMGHVLGHHSAYG
uniref:Inositol hexakisphosphate kinase 1 n=1 Tax=Macaca nemestrina TaxID=9545 RepID=A0A2K6ATN1_MACNE